MCFAGQVITEVDYTNNSVVQRERMLRVSRHMLLRPTEPQREMH